MLHMLCNTSGTLKICRNLPNTTLLYIRTDAVYDYGIFILLNGFMTLIYTVNIMYSTAQFKLYTRVQVHACASMFNVCKTSKTGVCMQCCMQFWHVQAG